MKPIPVLGIPHFNRPDLLARCIASIDYGVARLVIINNGPVEQMVYFYQSGDGLAMFDEQSNPLGPVPSGIEEIEEISHPNSGVAGAWNEIIKLYPSDYWLIANNDIQFSRGDLQKMAEFVEGGTAKGDSFVMVFGNHGASWFAITAFGVKHVGLFDENIYPAYLEDCDWHYRAKLAAMRTENVPGVNAMHGDTEMTGSCTIMSDPDLRRKNGGTHGRNHEYYRAKWGGDNGQETFTTPFNMPGVPVTYWSFDPFIRARQQW